MSKAKPMFWGASINGQGLAIAHFEMRKHYALWSTGDGYRALAYFRSDEEAARAIQILESLTGIKCEVEEPLT